MSINYIYLIEDSSGLLKIGYSSNPQRRLKQLQTAHGTKLTLVCCAQAPKYVEKRLHKMFLYNKQRGEWFSASLSLKSFIIDYLKERYTTQVYQ